jgi:endonuclease/exonuclease/phosphatase (EEP) superfamily protein YafD
MFFRLSASAVAASSCATGGSTLEMHRRTEHARANVRLASLNVCSFIFAEPEEVAKAIEAHGPFDVLALQEVGASEPGQKQVRQLAALLGMGVAIIKKADKKVGLGNAILVRPTSGAAPLATAHWNLFAPRESRVAVAADLPYGLRVCCTHLDHRDEGTRLSQLQQLEGRLDGSFVLVGDLNALRRADYRDEEWDGIVRARQRAGIETETELTEQLERPADAGGWGLSDCRAVARHVAGATATSVHGARVD